MNPKYLQLKIVVIPTLSFQMSPHIAEVLRQLPSGGVKT